MISKMNICFLSQKTGMRIEPISPDTDSDIMHT